MKHIIESRWNHTEYTCVIVCTSLGHRCGYVGIPSTHPLYEVAYMDVDDIEVHGGLTYSGFGDFEYPVFQNVKNAKWFLGFDTGHYVDAPDPEILKMFDVPTQLFPSFHHTKSTVKTNDYCINEVKKLAEQLKMRKKQMNIVN